jgi:hypothetical protein
VLKHLSFSARRAKSSPWSGRAARANRPSPRSCSASTIRNRAGFFSTDARDRLRPPRIARPDGARAAGSAPLRRLDRGEHRLRKPGATQPEIEAAARRANAHDFIAQFPEGYATLVGERGVKVSGGQRQRIAIARALLKDPSILILDEATSALDAESERLVQQALEELMKGRTCFVIAHRLSTIRNADTIVMLRDGAVRETGSHDELMAIPDGAYRRMVELQHGANVLTEEAEVAAKCAVSLAVERPLHTRKVTGSNPVPRTFSLASFGKRVWNRATRLPF